MEYIKQNFNKIILLIFAAVTVLITYRVLYRSPVLHRVEQQVSYPALDKVTKVAEPLGYTEATTLLTDQHLAERVDKGELSQLIRNYILDNPEVLIQSLELLQSRKFEQKIKSITGDPALYLGLSPVVGNRDGDIKILVFTDYACSYCKRANAVLAKLLATDKGVQVIYEYVASRGAASEYAIKAAMATNLRCPEFFSVVHNALISMPDLHIENIRNMMISQKLPIADLDQEINNPTIRDDLQRVANLTSILGIKGTPVLIINDEFLVGFAELEKLQQVIKDLRRQAQNAKE